MAKLRVGILFGGRSGEHEVSLLSAASVLNAIDHEKFEVIPLGITKEGRWVTATDAQRLLEGEGARLASSSFDGILRAGDSAATSAAALLTGGADVALPHVPTAKEPPAASRAAGRHGRTSGADISGSGHAGAGQAGAGQAGAGQAGGLNLQAGAEMSSNGKMLGVDVLFPVLHGTFGEDGTIQGLFELAEIAYVGSGVLGSAAGMDKDVMKRLFASSKLPLVKHVTLLRADWQLHPRKTISLLERQLRYPLFVKPANLGSSVGISKAHDRSELGPALELAARYDRKIVVEQGVGGSRGKARELEVAVLGNDRPEASVVGEIVPAKEFYDYEAKYQTEGSELIIPARLSRAQTREVQRMAIAAFQACDCAGLARVDFLMDPGRRGKEGRIYVNEVNTMPGFTSISMYPKLWAASGVSYQDLITRLIELALERRAERDQNSYSI
ncbi:MAG TPA: D-alanine--D-alanine ligase family protein [Acidisarcina sp.]